MMTKRNASEYIIGSIQGYPVPTRDTVIAGLSSGLARWACRSSVAHSSRVVVVVVAASLCELHSSGAACSKYTQACRVGDPACNIPISMRIYVTSTHVMLTFARSAHS